jgi:hypothetical protein
MQLIEAGRAVRQGQRRRYFDRAVAQRTQPHDVGVDVVYLGHDRPAKGVVPHPPRRFIDGGRGGVDFDKLGPGEEEVHELTCRRRGSGRPPVLGTRSGWCAASRRQLPRVGEHGDASIMREIGPSYYFARRAPSKACSRP